MFGTWAGTAVNDTLQVVAAGFAYGAKAGEVATAVKLTRILVALAGVGLGTRFGSLRRIGPRPFVIGFATAATTALASRSPWLLAEDPREPQGDPESHQALARESACARFCKRPSPGQHS